MKKNLGLLSLFIAFNSIAQTTEWVNYHTGIGYFVNSRGNTLYSSDSLYVYSVGEFTGSVDFDPGPSVDTRVAVDQEDVFIQKYHANGNLIWTKTFGGSGRESSPGFCVKGNEIYIAGSFYGTVDFDPGTGTASASFVGLAPYAAIGYGSSLYLLKLDSAGIFQWVHAFGDGTSHRGIRSVNIDQNGDVYTVATVHDRTGSATTTFDLDPTAGTDNFTHLNTSGIIQKFDAAGNYIFGKKFNGTTTGMYPSEVYIENSTIDNSNNLITAGHFNGNVDFDPSAGVNNINSVSEYDFFIQKFDNTGNPSWIKTIGSSGSNSWSSITQMLTDSLNNVYVSGFIRDTLDLNPDAGVFMVNASSTSMVPFLMKLDPSGNFLFAKTWAADTSSFGASINDIGIDLNNNIFLTGYFFDTLDLDPGTGVALVNSTYNYNFFLVELDQLGNFIQGFSIGDTSYSNSTCVSLDPSNAMYISGYFDGVMDFDPSSGTMIENSATVYVSFIAKYNPAALLEIAEVSSLNQFNVFPNPSVDFLTISVKEMNDKLSNNKIELIDFNGKIVPGYTVNNIQQHQLTLNISTLVAGIYYVRLSTPTTSVVKKFVKAY